MRRAIQITLSLFIALSAGCESDTKTGSSSDESVGPFASYELSDTGRALLRGPTEDALEALRLEHEPTEGEVKTAALYWAFMIAAVNGEPVNRMFFYPEFQAKIAALGANFPSLVNASSAELMSAQQALIQSSDDFMCGGSCLPDLAGIAEASLSAALDIGITGALSRVKESTKTVASHFNRLGTRANASAMLGRSAAVADGADLANSYLGAEGTVERAAEIDAATASMTAGDVAELTSGGVGILGLTGVSSPALAAVGAVAGAFAAGYAIGDEIYQAQRLVEACLLFQEQECDCGNGELDAGEACDWRIAEGLPGSCPVVDSACEPASEMCTANRVTGDYMACSERCEPSPIEYCESGDGCCPTGCTNDPNAPASLYDSDCMPVCGNGIREYQEECDGQDLGGAVCGALPPFDGGEVQCAADCTLDTSACTHCGNGVIESGEVCDFGQIGMSSCQDFGLPAGELRCDLSAQCQSFDTSRCDGRCGNGALDEGEACDGDLLGGQTCQSLGLGEGSLSCRADCTLNEAVCGVDIEPVRIEGGSFMMGSNDGYDYEQPVHQVQVSTFWIAESEVTIAQYRKCVEAGVCTEPSVGEYCTWGRSGYENHPVNCVDWGQARTFSRWIGGDLPTEAQWEYAARGGQSFLYAGSNNPDEVAWYSNNADSTREVKGKRANGYGLYDMSGNVWEWTLDEWHYSYSGAPSNGDQPWGSTPTCSTVCDRGSSGRVDRGGSWRNGARHLRVAHRFYNAPGNRYSSLGFRAAGPIP